MKHISRILWSAVLALVGLCPSVASAQEAVTLPFSSDFSTDTPWTLVNDEGKNVWVIGEDANTNADGKGLFTSLDGSRFAYNWPTTSGVEKATSVSHAYLKVRVAANQNLLLSFRYFVGGDNDEQGDYVQAGLYVGLLDAAPTSGTIEAAEKYATPYANSVIWKNDPALWQEAVVAFDAPVETVEKYLVFTWYNHYNSNNYNVFAAIDDVALLVDDCPAPSALTVGETTAHSLTYGWTAGEGIADLNDYTYQIQKKTGTGNWEDVTPAPASTATQFTLSDLMENTAYGFRIRGYRSETSYSPWVTAPVTTTPYACPAPTDLAVEANAAGDYVFTWRSNEVTKYILEYRQANAADWTATAELTAATYTLPAAGLTPATAYEARVRGVCAETDLPNYTAVIPFTTPCGVMELPYTEDFDIWETDGSLSCWTILDVNGDGKKWGKETNKYTTHGQSPGCAKFGYGSNSNDWLISPALQIDVPSGVSFWVKANSTSYEETYVVWISETDIKPESFVELLPAVTFSNADWEEKKIVLDEKYVGKKVYIGFQCTSNYKPGLYIDDFSVNPYPAPLISASVTTNSATLALMPNAASYTVRYRISGTADWMTLTNQASPLTLNDLTSGTTYEVQAQAHYAGGHDSEFSDIMTFGTCVALPYSQDFSSVEVGKIPVGWNQNDKSNFEFQVAESEGIRYLNFPKQYNSGYVYSGYSRLILPVLSLENVEKDRLELIFTYSQKAYASRLDVSLSVDGGVNWTKLTGNGNSLGALLYASSAANVVTDTKTLSLKELVGEASTLMIRFEGTYSSSSDIVNLYDVRVQEHPRCLPPTDLHVVTETQTATAAELAWLAPAEAVPTVYKFAYAETEADLEIATAEELPAETVAKRLENLQPNHTAYHVRMTSVCGDEGESDPVTLSFHTLYTCPKITDLHLTQLTDKSVRVAFSYTKDEIVNYEAEYKETAAADWTPLPAFGTPAFEVTALQADTRYLVRTRVVCAADDESLWDTVAFKTPCGLTALPLREGFEAAFTEHAPAGWQYVPLTGRLTVPQWERVANIKYRGGAALRHPGNAGGTALLVSPYLDMAADRYYRLSFALRREGYESGKTDSLGIWFNTAPTLDGGRLIKAFRNHEDDANSEELVDGVNGKWELFTFDSLTDMGKGYLMLYAKGDEKQDHPFYVDELSLTQMYATNLELQAVVPMPSRANMGEETVAVVLNNTGEKDFIGEVTLSYQVNGLPPVSETLALTDEAPLASQTPYTYTFNAKADLSAKGRYTVKAMLASAEDPLPDDNAAELTTESYEALTLPFETDFSPASAGAAYIHTVNADQDDYEWILPPAQPQAMIYGRNSGHLDDYLYTPGLKLSAGKYAVRITYAARQASYWERLSLGAYTHFTAKEAALPILTDTTAATAQKTVEGVLEIAGDGIYMLGIHAESDSSRGINVYGLSIKALSQPNPLVGKVMADTICNGETYPFGRRELTEAGRYVDTVRAAEVDTVRELTLTVLPKPVPPVISCEDEGKTVTLVAETPEAQVQWYEADQMIYGAEEKRFTVPFDGVYHATAIGECGESEASNKIKVELLAVEDGLSADEPVPSVYPNPSSDGRFTLQVPASYDGATLYVYGVDGRLRQRRRLRAGEQEVRLDGAPSGVYMLRIVSSDGRTYSLKATVR